MFDFEDVQEVKDDVDDYDWKGVESFPNDEMQENFPPLEPISPKIKEIEENISNDKEMTNNKSYHDLLSDWIIKKENEEKKAKNFQDLNEN